MAPLAATATTPLHDLALGILALTALTLGYLAWCYVAPFTACGRCDGNGKERTRSGRAWKPCPRCHGRGHRLRLGRHVVNYLRRARRDVPRQHQGGQR